MKNTFSHSMFLLPFLISFGIVFEALASTAKYEKGVYDPQCEKTIVIRTAYRRFTECVALCSQTTDCGAVFHDLSQALECTLCLGYYRVQTVPEEKSAYILTSYIKPMLMGKWYNHEEHQFVSFHYYPVNSYGLESSCIYYFPTGKVMMIKTEKDLRLMLLQFTNMGKYQEYYFGLSDSNNENELQWFDGTPFNGFPNGFNPTFLSGTNNATADWCTIMKTDTGYDIQYRESHFTATGVICTVFYKP